MILTTPIYKRNIITDAMQQNKENRVLDLVRLPRSSFLKHLGSFHSFGAASRRFRVTG